MKKLFTLASVMLALTATAAPKMHSLEGAVLNPEAQQRMATNLALLQNNQIESIEGDVIAKRTYYVGNWEYDLSMIVTGNFIDMVSFQQWDPTFDDLPTKAVEYYLQGYNTATSKETAIAILVGWPTRYYEQLMTWEGPWEEVRDDDGEINYDIPVADRNYEIVPIAEMLPGNPLAARIMATGYASPLTRNAETADERQWAGPYSWPCLGFNGLQENGADITLTSDWSFENQNGDTTFVEIQDYSYDSDSDEEYILASNHFYFTKGVNKSNLDLEYDGTFVSNGFIPRDYNIEVAEMHLFNAGNLTEDNSLFYEMPEDGNELQQYLMMFTNSEATVGVSKNDSESVTADPTFENCCVDNNYWRFFLASQDSDISKMFFGKGYLFSAEGAAPTSCQWNLAEAENHTFQILGKDVEVEDYLIPEANMFVQYGLTGANGNRSGWASDYGTWTNKGNQLMLSAFSNGIMANSTPEGFMVSYMTKNNDTVHFTFNQPIVYHSNYDDTTQYEDLSPVGDFTPNTDSVKALFNNNGVKVSARNGMIFVESMNAENVMVYSLNGGLVKASNGRNVIVNAPKGMYIVKVGKEVRKVVL